MKWEKKTDTTLILKLDSDLIREGGEEGGGEALFVFLFFKPGTGNDFLRVERGIFVRPTYLS